MSNGLAKINGAPVEVRSGETILAAARRAGAEIPTLCYAENLLPEGGCRLCLVQTNRSRKPVAACYSLIQPGMEIQTHTAEIESLRRDVLSLYLGTDAAGFLSDGRETPFTRLLEKYNLPVPKAPSSEAARLDASHTYLRFNPQLCINCRRCMNACEQIQGQFVYSMDCRGPATHLIFGPGKIFAQSACVSCGACVDQCPTFAISDRDRIAAAPAESATQSVCGYCGVGCRIEIEAAGGKVQRIRGVSDAAVNRGHLCVKGRYAHAFHHSPDRLTQPLRRVGDEFVPISWKEALEFAAERLHAIRDQHGADALGAFTSSRSTNEACYLLQKLFRAVLGTNNVDCCARVCHSSTALALQLVTGTGAASASYEDIELARMIVLSGSNATEGHPVIGARIKQAVLRGAKLMVIDPRRIELAEYADIHLQLRPGTNVALFNGLSKVLIDEGLIDSDYLNERTEGLEELKKFLGGITLDEVATITEICVERIREAARLIGRTGPALFVTGLGLSELHQGTDSVKTLCNLGMLTGSIGRPGAGMQPLRGQNNVQGSADMGSMPNLVTGYQPIGDAPVRERLREIWGAVPPEKPGLTIPEMIDAAARGQIRSLWIMGEDIVQSDPNETHVVESLSKLDFLIVQELFFSETARYAHLILPAAAALEQEGTFTNGERRIQHVMPAVKPPGEARPDWIAVRDAARAMGAAWTYESPAQVMDEVARVAPKLFGGVSYDRLDGDGLQWPCPSRQHPGTSRVHAEGFMRGKGKLSAIPYVESPEVASAEFPFILVTGRVLEHYNVGTMTRRTPNRELVPEDVLEVNPDDARREGISEGERIDLESHWGVTSMRVKLSERVAPRTVFAAFHYPGTHTNRVIGSCVDPDSKCPNYKVTAVRLRPARVEVG